MSTKFSEDVIPLTDLKVNPGRVVKHATAAHRPVLLTSRGRGVIVTKIEALADLPGMGRIIPEFDQPFLRALIWQPFRIVYQCDQKQVRVVRVWHSERLLAQPIDSTDNA